MFKVLIADDEPRIRNGLCSLINWGDYGMIVIGTAKNGKEALEIADEKKPELCLIDICMPIMDGINLIRNLNERNPKSINIIVSGHDEFEYAQQSIKLKVFDYVLKPIMKEDFLKVILKAKHHLEEQLEKERQYKLASTLLEKNLPVLRYRFLSDWLKGNLTHEEIAELMDFHKIRHGNNNGLIVVKTIGSCSTNDISVETDKQLKLCMLQNMIEESVENLKPFIITVDEYQNLVVIVTITDESVWDNIKNIIEEKSVQKMDLELRIYKRKLDPNTLEICNVYEEILKEIEMEYYCLPVVNKVKSYIEQNWQDSGLSLHKIAAQIDVSTNHLSKLFKQELGISFTDYLIKRRITEAVRLLSLPHSKINEVAEKVGYSTQHYFCAAFKKVLGITPSEYRKKCHSEG